MTSLAPSAPRIGLGPARIHAVWEITLRCGHARERCGHARERCGSRAGPVRDDEPSTAERLVRLVHAVRAPGAPYDFGGFTLREEPWSTEAPPEAPRRSLPVVGSRRRVGSWSSVRAPMIGLLPRALVHGRGQE